MTATDTKDEIDFSVATVADLSVELEKSMIEKRQIVALDFRLVAVFLVLVLLFAGMFHWYWLALVYPVIHAVLWLMVRHDPDMVDVYLAYRRQGRRYVPRQGLRQRRNLRPDGFSRGNLC